MLQKTNKIPFMFSVQNRVLKAVILTSAILTLFLSPMKSMAIQRFVGEFYSNEIFSTLRKRGRQKNCKTAVETSIQNSETVDTTLSEYLRDFYLDEMRFHKEVGLNNKKSNTTSYE